MIFSEPEKKGAILPTGWLAPLYTTTFEMMIRDRLSQLNPEALVRTIRTQPVLFVARQGGQYAPVQDVIALATNVGGHREVMVAADGGAGRLVEQRACEFLVRATHWKGPKARGIETIEQFLKKQVK